VQAVSVHRDALVVTSRMWQTTATALRADGECMLIDSPYFPDELGALPHLLAQSGFEPSGLLATHADFDHLLGRLAFPELPLGVAEPTLLRLRAEPGAAQRELREYDARFYVERPTPLALGQVQSLPLPGKLELGEHELELHPAEGHATDGTAILAPELGVLACGDYLSPVEIPILVGRLDDYRATLARLARLVERAQAVVPGHGSPLGRERALRLLEEDLEYLDALERGEERPQLPPGRDSSEQRAAHTRNLRALTGAPEPGRGSFR
jgi:glyoxylase-like metal-dependent hydrolase (beta-lactamase superfamily II)